MIDHPLSYGWQRIVGHIVDNWRVVAYPFEPMTQGNMERRIHEGLSRQVRLIRTLPDSQAEYLTETP